MSKLDEKMLSLSIEVPKRTNGFVYVSVEVECPESFSYKRAVATVWNTDSTLDVVVDMVNLYNESKGFDVKPYSSDLIRALINLEKAETALENLKKAQAEVEKTTT